MAQSKIPKEKTVSIEYRSGDLTNLSGDGILLNIRNDSNQFLGAIALRPKNRSGSIAVELYDASWALVWQIKKDA